MTGYRIHKRLARQSQRMRKPKYPRYPKGVEFQTMLREYNKMNARKWFRTWGIFILVFFFFLLLVMPAKADREIIVRPGPQSCITTCSPTLGSCVTQCY